MSTPTFLVPDFDKNVPNKIYQEIEVKSKNTLSLKSREWTSVIASNGFPSKKDGVYVYVTRIDESENGVLTLGFTDSATYDSMTDVFPDGTSLYCSGGFRFPGRIDYLPEDITAEAKEIISILIISNDGAKKEVQWIVDGNEGPVHDCTTEKNGFGNGREIFPCVSFASAGQVTTIPFDQVKSRSPKIDQLMQEFNSNKNRNQSIVINQAPSTSTAQNDALISQLRDQIARSQDAAIAERDKQNQELKQLLALKDQQTERLIQSFERKDQQLELERAEHQKTRNLLHQIKMELKDVELYYLRLHQQNESGQRRQREGEEKFKVKEEPGN